MSMQQTPLAPAKSPALCLLGGQLDTGNLGVSALGIAAAQGVRLAFPSAHVIQQVWNSAERVNIPAAGGAINAEAILVHHSDVLRHRFGSRHLKMLHRIVSALPSPIARPLVRTNRTLEILLRCDATLDVSGGDSLADIYGATEFESQAQIKLLMRSLGVPLVLLPQTYGPFNNERSVRLVRQIIADSALVATREVGGLDELRSMLGKLPHDRIVCCPDMAFLLEPAASDEAAEPFVAERDERPLIGLNVSGMLQLSKRDYGLREPYPQLVDAILEWAMDRRGARVLLVPHVLARSAADMDLSKLDLTADVSDSTACAMLMQQRQRSAENFLPKSARQTIVVCRALFL